MSEPSEHEKLFHKYLQLLAMRCKVELDQEEIAIYDKYLQGYGYKKAALALEKVIVERSGRDPWPSVTNIIDIIENKGSKRMEALDYANQMIAFVQTAGASRYAQTIHIGNKIYDSRREAVIENLGEFALTIFDRYGGYSRFVDELHKSATSTFRAQLRDTIEAVRAKQPNKQPALSEENTKLLI